MQTAVSLWHSIIYLRSYNCMIFYNIVASELIQQACTNHLYLHDYKEVCKSMFLFFSTIIHVVSIDKQLIKTTCIIRIVMQSSVRASSSIVII